MKNLIKKSFNDFNINASIIKNEQIFISVQVVNKSIDVIETCKMIYDEIAKIVKEYDVLILHERVFGNKSLHEMVSEIRQKKINGKNKDLPFSLIEGDPYWGEGIAGVSIRGVLNESTNVKIENVKFEGHICGRLWKGKHADYIVLNSIHGLIKENEDYYTQSVNMLEKVNGILKLYKFEFKDIVRTWIYLNDILKQYDDFNIARNEKFVEYKLIPNNVTGEQFEKVYMPASTGIDCDNIFGAAGVIDVLAIKKKNKDLQIYNETGIEQKAAFRYGSAFSRAIVVKDEKYKYLYMSGTASIDDNGDTVFLNDIDKQIDMTGKVISSLIETEKFSVSDICEGTVFLKKPEYIKAFQKYRVKEKWENIPFIITVADVCRDNLLFEIDATLATQN